MAHPRKLIRQAVVALLISANTAAGAHVLGTRVDPNRKTQLPSIAVYTLGEETDQDMSVLSGPRELTRKLHLEVTAWVAHSDAVPADDAMDNIAEQIEAAMDAHRYLDAAVAITAVDHVTGQLTVPSHGLGTAGSALAVQAGPGGVLPAGLSPTAESWAIVVDDNTIKLATTISRAEAGTALTFGDNGTLPLQLCVPTAAESILDNCVMDVVEDDGRSDPLVGIVVLTYLVTYRTSPAVPSLGDFVTVDAKYQVEGGVIDTVPVEDNFVVEAP